MDRGHVEKKRLEDEPAASYVPGTPEERVALVWQLTREAVALGGRLDAEQRLQRHVACLSRRDG